MKGEMGMEFIKYCVMMDNISSRIIGVDETWGKRMPMMAMEELAELTQTISKLERFSIYRTDGSSYHNEEKLEDFKKEIADVYISLYSLLQHYDIKGSEIEELMNNKLYKNYCDAGAKLELNAMIDEYCGENGISEQTATRMINSLARNKINSLEDLRYTIYEKYAKGIKWHEKTRGIGPECAKYLEDIASNSLD